MKCTLLLLPLWVGLALLASNLSAKSNKQTLNTTLTSPLFFLENKGQITNQYLQKRNDIDFRLRAGKGLNLFVGAGKLEYQWSQSAVLEPVERRNNNKSYLQTVTSTSSATGNPQLKRYPNSMASAGSATADMCRMDVQLIDANTQAMVTVEEQQSYKEQYYIPIVKAGTITHSYQKIRYSDIYPHIDWVLYTKNGTMKYDFVVHPGGKVSDIKIKYSGATALTLNEDGSLHVVTPMGSIGEQAPISYTQEGRAVGSRFILSGNILSFAIAPYTGTLTIDPTIEWASYYGGLSNDQPSGIITDPTGNVYLTGGTLSVDNIATVGSYQTSYGGSSAGSYVMGDAFLSKYDIEGNCLWSTYYGGTEEDRGLGIAIDATTYNLYMAGSTMSTAGIATATAHQIVFGGGMDAFLVKFDTSGQRIWGTYYGGMENDGDTYTGMGITCDGNGHVYLCSQTASSDNIATTGAWQAAKQDAFDAFLVQFDTAGQRQWGTYFGSNGNDYPNTLSCDITGNIVMAGSTDGSTGIATNGSYQTVFGGGLDGFISSWTNSGTLSWATYLGSTGYDEITASVIDSSGTVYVSGGSDSPSGISTGSSFQPVYGGGPLDGLVASFSNNGAVNWSSYYGGPDIDAVTDMGLDEAGNIFLSGYTISSTGITTPGGIMDTLYNGTSESFLAKFNNEGQRLWGTYFGGSGYEINTFVAVGTPGTLYLAGLTNSAEGIATPGAQQQFFGGGDNDAYLAKINVCAIPGTPNILYGVDSVCPGQQYYYHTDPVPGASGYSWTLPMGWTGNSDTAGIWVTAGTTGGNISVAVHNYCATGNDIALPITIKPAPQPIITTNGDILATTQVYDTYQWIMNGQDIGGATNATYVATTSGAYSVRVSATNGCSGTSDTMVLGTVDINDVKAKEAIHIYPNPTSGRVYIKATVPIQVRVSSMAGRLLLATSGDGPLSLTGWPHGLYLIQIYDAKNHLLKTEKLWLRSE